MRILRMHIASFGRIRDRRIELSPDLTVIHGPNESGKTTTMEFLRNTMVPTSSRSVYPERARTDSGSITFDEDGTEGTMTLTQKARGGDVPDYIAKLDPALYRSIFAMSQKDLDDEKAVTSDDISSRFLTVPGGDGMPRAMDSMNAEIDGILGKTSRSPSRVNGLSSKISSKEESIAVLRSRAESYGALARERAELESRLAEEMRSSESDREDERICNLYDSQKTNFDSLASKRKELFAIGEFRRVSDADRETESRLRARCDAESSALDEHREGRKGKELRLSGVDAGRIPVLRDRMRKVVDGRDSFGGRKDTITIGPSPAPAPVKGKTSPMAFLGLILVVAGLAASMISPYALALSAVGAVVAAVGFLKRPQALPAQEPQMPVAEEPDGYEAEVNELASELGLPRMSVRTTVQSISEILTAYDELVKWDADTKVYENRYLGAKGELDAFYMPYAGKEGFDSCSSKSQAESRLRQEIQTLTEAIRASGLDPNRPICPVERRGIDTTVQNDLSREIGRITNEMGQVLDTTELDSLEDEVTALREELRRELVRGATAVLAMDIASSACDDAYSSVQPGVVETADRYLSMMTCGRYRLDLDPRRKEALAVRDADGSKGMRQWSTGLRGQVLLSLKLAVARELGGGRIPMILDDVLLTFDSGRKEGAVRALAEVSSEMQILLFTCDDSVRDIASGTEGARVIELDGRGDAL